MKKEKKKLLRLIGNEKLQTEESTQWRQKVLKSSWKKINLNKQSNKKNLTWRLYSPKKARFLIRVNWFFFSFNTRKLNWFWNSSASKSLIELFDTSKNSRSRKKKCPYIVLKLAKKSTITLSLRPTLSD